MNISIVVAVAENDVIGSNNKLLWQLPADMQFFKEKTLHHHVLMGRKTYESIPAKFRPLSQRTNLIITRNAAFAVPGCFCFSSIKEGIEFAENHGEDELMVIGGAQIYREIFPLVDIIYLTRVAAFFPEADAFFPAIDPVEWVIKQSLPHNKDNQHPYAFEFLELHRNRQL